MDNIYLIKTKISCFVFWFKFKHILVYGCDFFIFTERFVLSTLELFFFLFV